MNKCETGVENSEVICNFLNMCITFSLGLALLSLSIAVVSEFLPKFILEPKNTFARRYSSVNLTCLVSGNPQPTIQWYKDGEVIKHEMSQYYVIESVDIADRGSYWCTASNSLGSITSNTALVNIHGIQQYLFSLYVPEETYEGFNVDEVWQTIYMNKKMHIKIFVCSTYSWLHNYLVSLWVEKPHPLL